MEKPIIVSNKGATLDTSRRNFLKLGGVGLAVAGLTLAGCRDDNYQYVPDGAIFDLGKGDVGILNFAYALEQLEADFYTKVVNSFYSGISSVERQLFTDIYNHEIIHRDFFKAAISGAAPTQLLPTLEFKYDGVDFTSRNSILATAKALEDTGVGAYNAAGKYITDLNYLVIAGKIVSIEARHASAIRDAINPKSMDFAGDDVINVTTGLDIVLEPKQVVANAGPFIKTPFTWKEQGIG
ncbi:ferritin-like domain-containing protein [Halpernia frigidisoli]|uniref:Tat (Twin-arginine translocation) pathway signal sequence n=1 Tax=Halpernia frigidisoli TaxID=1125876 RepID=A0A1I3FW60_9FLAO|nr:ferritin-like domain-containing protein [Halpernia frigidisoli]SFI15478.1 Tat (twin-arginine translocation) pathway signal sequence [Halpernia frigidisoli]